MLPRQPPITGQRKIFPFITRIFLCSSSHGQKRAGLTTAFAWVGTGIDNDEGDEYKYDDESKEETEWRSDGRRWR